MGATCWSSLSKDPSSAQSPAKRLAPALHITSTGFPTIDSLFHAAENPLERVVRAHQKLQRAYKSFMHCTSAHHLTAPTIEDGIIAMLYIYSADSAGDFPSLSLIISPLFPYLQLDMTTLRTECQEVSKRWNCLITVMASTTDKIFDLPNELNEVKSNLVHVQSRTTKMLSGEGHSLAEQSQVLRVVEENVKVITDGISLAQETAEFNVALSSRLHKVFTERLKEPELLTSIKSVGRAAHRSGLFSPRKLLMLYWPEEKRILR